MAHRWTYEDDVVACFICKYGTTCEENGLLFDVDEIGTKLGMGKGSLKARVGNFKFLEGKGKLCNVANLSKQVYKDFKKVPKTIHLKKVKEILGMSVKFAQ